MKKTVYIDLNIFDKLEKINDLPETEKDLYGRLLALLRAGEIIVPYSNAHISDLYRGYLKNPAHIPGHLKNLETISNNLCIVQYWGEKEARWHKRNPLEFFDSTKSVLSSVSPTFSSLFSFTDEPLIQQTWELHKEGLRLRRIDENFKKIYTNPIFNSIYPRTKTEMNMLALCEDIYSFSIKIKTDFALYKSFRKYLNELRLKYPEYVQLYQKATKKLIDDPAQLTWDGIWEAAVHTHNNKGNTYYDKIVNLFITTDLKGYRPDERFANLIDDALHSFYGAHCDYFITLDKRCQDKAKKMYTELQIKTSVFSPDEFIKIF